MPHLSTNSECLGRASNLPWIIELSAPLLFPAAIVSLVSTASISAVLTEFDFVFSFVLFLEYSQTQIMSTQINWNLKIQNTTFLCINFPPPISSPLHSTRGPPKQFVVICCSSRLMCGWPKFQPTNNTQLIQTYPTFHTPRNIQTLHD